MDRFLHYLALREDQDFAVALHGPKPGGMVLFVGLHRPQRLLNGVDDQTRHLFKLCAVRSECLGDEKLRFRLGCDPLHAALTGVRVTRDCLRGLS